MEKICNFRNIDAFATIIDAQREPNGYNFLRLPVSAHAAALGGDNITSIEDDEALIFHNPALRHQ